VAGGWSHCVYLLMGVSGLALAMAFVSSGTEKQADAPLGMTEDREV
jgi:uncharacterized membrane protein YuzA (DUF378 family)